MAEKQVSVGELLEYWEYIKTLKNGDVIERYVGTSEMPPWDAICSELDWRLYKADGGYFGKNTMDIAAYIGS